MRLVRASVAAILIYLLLDTGSDFLLGPIGLTYLHAFIAMFGGMFVGGWIARRSFVPVAVSLSLAFSMLSYVLVASMRDQDVLDLILEQHPMISVGAIVGAALGAIAGQFVGERRTVGQQADGENG
jgi:hypothetical protein